MPDKDDTPNGGEAAPALPELRFLKALVTALAGVMIVGLLAILAILVIRFSQDPAGPALPAEITLPAGTTARAVTFGPGWYAVVTARDEILIFDAATGTLRQTVQIED
ncbi:DUF6476 family protein [Frigidibacter mobilis]|uniref:Uncharacterized protein n=1 Tax=Frigidibacter mobilis TaxID=1335048 RepID=A0A159Z4I9_9RHOB|nr:DUF6476 family protein [Frigidibacter mobilis]AMY70117.1 hypothetical protein AKL17_2881 [Frigidibacter mobilis]